MPNHYTTLLLIPTIQQKSHSEKLTTAQVEEANKMGVKGMPVNSTQYDLLKLVKFQVKRARHTSKDVKYLVKLHGRKTAKIIIKKRNELFSQKKG